MVVQERETSSGSRGEWEVSSQASPCQKREKHALTSPSLSFSPIACLNFLAASCRGRYHISIMKDVHMPRTTQPIRAALPTFPDD